MLDGQFRRQGHKVLLTLDNFAAHENLSYQPTNIRLKYFEPNMTSFVQPLDQGIIWCFKAHYHKAFCLQAIELNDAGADDIYKIKLLETMFIVKEAWDAVSPETIKNCWKHADIQQQAVRFLFQTCPSLIFSDLDLNLAMVLPQPVRLCHDLTHHPVTQVHGQLSSPLPKSMMLLCQ